MTPICFGKRKPQSLVLLLVFGLTALQYSAVRAEPLTADAMWRLKRLGDPAIAPDGRLAVLPVTSFDIEQNKSDTDLWLIPTKPGKSRQLTSGDASDSSPVWSPDGALIAFVSKRGDDKQPQLYVIPFDGGEARRITNVPTGVSAPKWFPDSRRIAFISQIWPDLKTWPEMEQRMKDREQPKMTAQVWDKAPISYWDHFIDDRQAHLYSISIAGGEPQPITRSAGIALEAADADATTYDISPDAAEIAFTADTDRSGIDQNLDIYVLPVEGGTTARNLTSDNSANDTTPIYSPDGRMLALRRQTLKGFYADRVRLAIYNRRDDKLRILTEDWDRSADGLVWSPDSQSLLGSIDDAGTRRVYRFEAGGGEPKPVTTQHSFGSLSVAGNGPVIVALRQSFSEPPTLVSIIGRNGTATKLSDFNDAALSKITLGKVESVTYKGADDNDIQMWVVYPPGFTPDRKWPLYMVLHGGPHNSMTDSYQWRWNAQVFASWGYVTAWHNFHGSSGFGQAFADSITKEWAELPYQDTIKATDWFSAQPWIDADRLAAGGGSYGGYLASLLLGKPQPFKALVAHAAVYDSYTQYASDDGAEKKRHGEFWEDVERFNRNSPHMNAANFKTPTLVSHGQQDLRVPVNHAFELFNTLQNRGVPSKLVYFPDENHWILKPQNSLFWYETHRQWLEKYVKPGAGDAAPPASAASAAASLPK